jgi:hypothetical protein
MYGQDICLITAAVARGVLTEEGTSPLHLCIHNHLPDLTPYNIFVDAQEVQLKLSAAWSTATPHKHDSCILSGLLHHNSNHNQT